MTLSKSSTLTKSLRSSERRREKYMHFGRKKGLRAHKRLRGPRDEQSFFFRIKSSAIRAFGGCLGSKRR